MYLKTKTLGKGSFGIVYKGHNVNNIEDYVAIKQYTNISKKDIPYQILREINIMNLLKHPNIIAIREVIQANGNIELVMDYGGENLRSYSNKTPYQQKIKEIKSIAYQILMGCLYMHKLDIIHRDLKPENILINKTLVKICDFGLAKKLPPFKNKDNSYQICTLCYKPPELFSSDNKKYTNAVDVWSIGCLLYEIISGKPIFEGTTETVVLKNILSKIPTTQQDLDAINLDCFKLEYCNTEIYYKLAPLYNSLFDDTNMISLLDDFKSLIESMLVIDPAK